MLVESDNFNRNHHVGEAKVVCDIASLRLIVRGAGNESEKLVSLGNDGEYSVFVLPSEIGWKPPERWRFLDRLDVRCDASVHIARSDVGDAVAVIKYLDVGKYELWYDGSKNVVINKVK